MWDEILSEDRYNDIYIQLAFYDERHKLRGSVLTHFFFLGLSLVGYMVTVPIFLS